MKYVLILFISFFSGNLLANEYKTEISEFLHCIRKGK